VIDWSVNRSRSRSLWEVKRSREAKNKGFKWTGQLSPYLPTIGKLQTLI